LFLSSELDSRIWSSNYYRFVSKKSRCRIVVWNKDLQETKRKASSKIDKQKKGEARAETWCLTECSEGVHIRGSRRRAMQGIVLRVIGE